MHRCWGLNRFLVHLGVQCQFYLYLLKCFLPSRYAFCEDNCHFVENSGFFSVPGNCLRNSVANCNVTKPSLAFLKNVIYKIQEKIQWSAPTFITITHNCSCLSGQGGQSCQVVVWSVAHQMVSLTWSGCTKCKTAVDKNIEATAQCSIPGSRTFY